MFEDDHRGSGREEEREITSTDRGNETVVADFYGFKTKRGLSLGARQDASKDELQQREVSRWIFIGTMKGRTNAAGKG